MKTNITPKKIDIYEIQNYWESKKDKLFYYFENFKEYFTQFEFSLKLPSKIVFKDYQITSFF